MDFIIIFKLIFIFLLIQYIFEKNQYNLKCRFGNTAFLPEIDFCLSAEMLLDFTNVLNSVLNDESDTTLKKIQNSVQKKTSNHAAAVLGVSLTY